MEHERALELAHGGDDADDKEDKKGKKKSPTKDSIAAVTSMKKNYDIDVVIESGRGTIRQGPDWRVVMPYDYGYIRKTVATDGEPVDAMMGRDFSSQDVFVIHQRKLDTGTYDEPKVMFGYKDVKDALTDFLLGYSDGRGWDRVQSIDHVAIKDIKHYLSKWGLP